MDPKIDFVSLFDLLSMLRDRLKTDDTVVMTVVNELIMRVQTGRVVDVADTTEGYLTKSDVATIQLGLLIVRGFVNRWRTLAKSQGLAIDISQAPPAYTYLFDETSRVLDQASIETLVHDLQKFKESLPDYVSRADEIGKTDTTSP